MAKNQRSFYLENDTLQFIKDYQVQHELSSISAALDRIIFSLIMDNPIAAKQSKVQSKTENKKDIPNSIRNIQNTMRD